MTCIDLAKTIHESAVYGAGLGALIGVTLSILGIKIWHDIDQWLAKRRNK